MDKTTEKDEMLREIAKMKIEEMEVPGYEFPKEFSKTDWAIAIVVIVLSGIATIVGAWL